MIHDISCIIPIKSEEDIPYLKVLLDELCRQTDKYRLDIILVTKDDSKMVIKHAFNLKHKHEYVPPINIAENVDGISEARNVGSKQASGDILVHLDCDNVLDDSFAIHHLIDPIISNDVVMTYTPVYYDKEESKTKKQTDLIKYNNFLLKFEFVPRIPFCISKDVYREIGGLEPKNTMLKFCGKVLWYYPGGIKKVDIGTMVSPRHIIEKAGIKQKETVHYAQRGRS